MRVKLFFVILSIVFVASFMSANFTIDQSYLQEEYSFGQGIIGWANMSFVNQSLNSTLEDTFGNKISLLSLLDLNSDYNYSVDNLTGIINSDVQRILFTNTGFAVPFGNVEIFYQINLSNETILSGNITVKDNEGLIQELILDKRSEMNDLNSYLDLYNVYLRSRISSILGVSEIETKLESIESAYNSASSQEDYDKILSDLSKLEIPRISESENANLVSFVSDKDEIDLDFLAGIGGGNYTFGRDGDYKDYIVFWNQENLKPLITFREISSSEDISVVPVLSYFEISFVRPSSKVFLVIENLDGLDFKEDYGELSDGDYTYIDLSKVENNIVFTASENVDFLKLPFFIAPSLTSFSLGDTGVIIDSEEESRVSKWVLFVLIIIFLIILFIVSYILLKMWYDKKYENYLFKNRNHLYNLVVYINNAKRRGLSKSEIEKALKKAKWSNEQIRYVMRKYHGRRTGLWMPSLLSNKKMNPGQHKS